MKQHSVPENIMDVEFKLFGSLTAKQFGYIIAGGLIALFFFYLFRSFNSMLLAWIFAALSVILGLSLALIRINEQPFEVWLGNFLAAMFSSQKRVWRKEKKTPPSLDAKQVGASIGTPSGVTQAPLAQSPAQPYQVFKEKTTSKAEGAKQQQAAPSIPKHPFKALDASSQPSDQGGKGNLASTTPSQDVQFIPGSAQGTVKVTTNQSPNRPLSFPSSGTQGGPAQGVSDSSQSSSPSQTRKTDKGPVEVKRDEKPKGNLRDLAKASTTPTSPSKPSQPTVQAPSASQMPSTYTNKATQFSGIVPDKTQTLSTDTQTGETAGQVGVGVGTSGDLSEENKALRAKIVEHLEEKAKLEQRIAQTEKMYQELKRQNEQIMQKLELLKKKEEAPKPPSAQVIQPAAKEPASPPEAPEATKGKEGEKDTGLFMPKAYDGPSLTKKPNVISGIVKTSKGKLLPGVVVIVKNEKGRPVRAMRTNSLGQFITTTALDDGIYAIELSKNGYTFGRYEIRLSGSVLLTYEFIAD